jgi:2-polyprenyl-6-methoxyphenol hydroxylase-like FAD-dependent oxidoreductase
MHRMHDRPPVLIAGAGIGGATLAVALGQRGVPVRLLERAPALRPVGAGITMQPNAMAVLARLGLDGRVRAAGCAIEEAWLRRADGTALSRVDLGGEERQIVGIHRAALLGALLEGRDVPIELGFEAVGYAPDADGVTVRASDGREVRGAALVGADGLHSTVRAQLLGETALRYSGYTSWRGVCDAAGIDHPRGLSTETWGRGRRFGIVPIGGDRLYWFATENGAPGGTDASVDALLERFAELHEPVEAILRATPPEAVLRTDIHDRAPVDRWTEGRVALLGDAAHPMTPNLGQGGCQAVEDAWVLAEAWTEASSPEEAFARYQDARLERANALVRMSWDLGRTAQWESGVARFIRDLAVRGTPRWLLERRLRQVLDAAPV